jgi:riboflavin transporter FmnP
MHLSAGKRHEKKQIFYVCLAAVILSAFLTRYACIRFGFPLITHPDEPEVAEAAINIVRSGDLQPRTFIYPSFYTYLQALAYAGVFAFGKLAGVFQNFSDIERTTLYFWGRLLTILLSVGAVYVTYLIGQLLFDKVCGIVSALFTSLSLLHVTNSYTITVDCPMAFWVLVSFFVSALSYVNGPRVKYYLLNGILIGFASGTKYTAIWCIVPMVWAHFHHIPFSLRGLFDKRLLAGLLLIPAAFVATTPFAVICFKTFVFWLRYQGRAYSLPGVGAPSGITSFAFYLRSLVDKFGTVQLAIAAAGIICSRLNDKEKTYFLMSFALPYYLFFGAFPVHFDRNMVVLVPFLALFCGCFFHLFPDCLKKVCRKSVFGKHQHLTYALIIVLGSVGLCDQGRKIFEHIKRMRLPDTRWVSKVWIEQNIPAGSSIGREHYTPPVDTKSYRVSYLGFHGLKNARLDDFDYIIASSGDYERFFRDEKRYPAEVQKYRQIHSKYKLVKEFVPDNKHVTGPVIRIYKIK